MNGFCVVESFLQIVGYGDLLENAFAWFVNATVHAIASDEPYVYIQHTKWYASHETVMHVCRDAHGTASRRLQILSLVDK